MRWTQTLIPTLKEDPADAEAVSHKLMVRAGLIRKLSAGTYIYLPLGIKALNKAANIVREEMNRAGAVEILMPALQPTELWEQTGRLKTMADIIFQFKDNSGKPCMLGPTHEEIVTYLAANEINSYRQLPINLYQIQTKFRDELRPRSGVIRSKEFLMKDGYSFDADEQGLEKNYQAMYQAYRRIFDRAGLNYVCIEGDSGPMGGNFSQEFMTPSPVGEDIFVQCAKCGYAATLTLVPCGISHGGAEATEKSDLGGLRALSPTGSSSSGSVANEIKEVATPGTTTIEAVGQLLKVGPDQMVKTMICTAGDKPIAVLLRGDHELNLSKLARLLKEPNTNLADEKTIEKVTGGPMGFSGPVGLKGIQIIADNAVMDMVNFVTGANKKDMHLVNTNIDRDFKPDKVADVRLVTEKDSCPKCQGSIQIKNGLEIGHIFKLGTKYSKILGAMYLDEKGVRQPMIMGCYGIGINRIVAALIECSSDANGIIWSKELAPYRVLIISIKLDDPVIRAKSEQLYKELSSALGGEVLWDDRDISPGIKFKDADLLGIPVIVTIGKSTVKDNTVDIKIRKDNAKKAVPFEQAVAEISKLA
ncbi:MAG: proline--tRNA ligase [Planctomycetota bacterium]